MTLRVRIGAGYQISALLEFRKLHQLLTLLVLSKDELNI